jgi:translation elongation factor EF-1beta
MKLDGDKLESIYTVIQNNLDLYKADDNDIMFYLNKLKMTVTSESTLESLSKFYWDNVNLNQYFN